MYNTYVHVVHVHNRSGADGGRTKLLGFSSTQIRKQRHENCLLCPNLNGSSLPMLVAELILEILPTIEQWPLAITS